MKLLVLSVLFLSTVDLQAQGPPARPEAPEHAPGAQWVFEHEEECGSPIVESMAWIGIDGTVIKVVDGRTFILRTSEGKRVHVDLAGLETNDSQAPARQLLSSLVQGQVVHVLVKPSNAQDKRVIGKVHVGTKEVNREMLRAGVARFKEPPPYSVSSYSSCLSRRQRRRQEPVLPATPV